MFNKVFYSRLVFVFIILLIFFIGVYIGKKDFNISIYYSIEKYFDSCILNFVKNKKNIKNILSNIYHHEITKSIAIVFLFAFLKSTKLGRFIIKKTKANIKDILIFMRLGV